MLEGLCGEIFDNLSKEAIMISIRVRVKAIPMGRYHFLTALHHRYQAIYPSLALLINEIQFMPISWRKVLIDICQTGGQAFRAALCPIILFLNEIIINQQKFPIRS
jgi:hypothetical protein